MRVNTAYPFLAVLMLGTVSQIAQVLFLRELLMVFHGNELSIGLILAAWMAWVGTGSRLGAVLVDRVHRPLYLLLLNAAGMVLILPVTVLLIRSLRRFFDILPGAYLSLSDMTLSCMMVMAPACLLLGAQFVLLSRIWREADQAVDTSGAGKTYICEAAGNMLGGILFTFMIVHYLNAFQATVLAGIAMLGFILLMCRNMPDRARHLPGGMRITVFGVLLLALFSLPFLERLDRFAYTIQWQYFAPQYQLVETYQSKHGVINAVQREDQYSFFQSGHLVFTIAGPTSPTPELEEQEAAKFAHVAMVQHRDPKRVLLVGGGLHGALREILRHPVTQVDYIELDEALTRAARRYVPASTRDALADPRVHLIHTDGRLFIKSAQDKYDIIIVYIPDPATAVVNRFYTREFFREAEARLYPDGVFVTGTTSTADLRGRAIANRNTTVYHTLATVFSHVLVAGDRFMFYVATNAPEQVSMDVLTLQKRYRERDINTDGFSEHHFHTLLEPSQLQRVNWIIRNHGRRTDAHIHGPLSAPLAPGTIDRQIAAEKELPPVDRRHFINSDFQPIGYYYTLMFWEELTRAGDQETLKRLLHVQPWWILPLIFMPLLAVIVLRAAGNRISKTADTRFAVLVTVFTTGFSTMTLQIALLFSFQSIYGFVYEMVGLIVAMFMGGLALGTFLTHRFIRDKTNINTLAAVQIAIAMLSALIAVALPHASGVASSVGVFGLFSGLTFAAGLINGVDFPLSAGCYMALSRRAEKSAGMVYGVELFGACIGAALASVIIAPVLGIIACCLVAGIANAVAFVVIYISRRTYD